jgi:hypothetical protein
MAIPLPILNPDSEPYKTIPTELTPEQQTILDLAWLRVDDCFDSIPGGPRLRDVSKQQFGLEKSALLMPFAIDRINAGNPPTNFTLEDYPYTDDHTLLARSLAIEIIRHLMRSYVEQPLPQGGGNITYLSRRDYQQRWGEILQDELAEFKEMLKWFKRKYLGLGDRKGLIQVGWGQGYTRAHIRPRTLRFWR